MSGRVLVGTCNWSDHQAFYPKGLPATSRLAYYARFFSLVEVDSTFYGIPPPNRTANWAGSTPDRFLFNVKAYRSMTYHERKGGVPRDPTEDEVSQFAECLAPLRASGKLRAVHYQFPPWFGWSPLDLDRLSRLRDRHPDDLLVVEFRNRSWTEPERWLQVVDLLRESQIALCIVDEPQLGTGSFPRLTEVTDPRLAVVRYHGRNAHSWYVQGKSSEIVLTTSTTAKSWRNGSPMSIGSVSKLKRCTCSSTTTGPTMRCSTGSRWPSFSARTSPAVAMRA